MNSLLILSAALLLVPPRSSMIGDPEKPQPPVNNSVITPAATLPPASNSDIFPERPSTPSPALEAVLTTLSTRLDSLERSISNIGPACTCSSHSSPESDRSQQEKATVYYMTDKNGKVWYSIHQNWLATWVDQQNRKSSSDSRVKFATQNTPVETDPNNGDLPKLIFKKDISGHFWYDVRPDRLEGWVNQKNLELGTQTIQTAPVIQPPVTPPPVYMQGSSMNYSSGFMNYGSPSLSSPSMMGGFSAPLFGGGFLGRAVSGGGCGPSGCF